MIGMLANHLWQSTLFAFAIALLALAFRRNRAQIRYALWFSASLKLFVPFALLLSLGSHFNSTPSSRRVVSQNVLPQVSAAAVQVSEPFEFDSPFDSTSHSRLTHGLALGAFVIWAIGFCTIALMRLRRWRRIRAILRTSTAFSVDDLELPAGFEVRTTTGLGEPGVIGFWHPVLLFPAGIENRLTPQQLSAVLTHELCHIERRDNLTSAIHMVVEAAFWFYPLVWWIGARLMEERERACDEAVLQSGCEPQEYAEGILNVCKTYVESPLRCVSGVTGADLKKRIRTILNGYSAAELNMAGKAALAAAAIAALILPIGVGIVGAPILRAQTQTTSGPKFDTASIKPCQQAPSIEGLGGGNGNSLRMTPGRLDVTCMTTATLIRTAYGYQPINPLLNSMRLNVQLKFENLYGLGMEDGLRVRGGPGWARSDKYTIEAAGDASVDAQAMSGPMLLALLESRFLLKAHIESEEIPGYALVVGKDGLKIKPAQEACMRRDPSSAPMNNDSLQREVSAVRRGEKSYCGQHAGVIGPDIVAVVGGGRPGGLTGILGAQLDAQVVDRTGIPTTDTYNFVFEFGPDETTPGKMPGLNPVDDGSASTPRGPNIFTALEQLGLKLEPIKVPREYIVIDRLERPTPN